MLLDIILYIILGHALLIAVIVGLVRGFSRQLSRPLVGLISIVCAILLVALLYPMITSTGILNGIMAKAGGWFTPEFYSKPIDSVETLQDVISDNYLRILSGSAKSLFARMQATLGDNFEITIGNFFGVTLINMICELVMWIIFYIALKYLLIGVRYLLKKISSVVVFKSIDKILGLVWSLLWTYIIVVGIIFTTSELIVVKLLPDHEATFAAYISNSTILRFLHNTNVLGSFIANLLGTNLVTIA